MLWPWVSVGVTAKKLVRVTVGWNGRGFVCMAVIKFGIEVR